MARRVNFEVEDETLRRVRVLAAEADTSVSGAMRALVELWLSDERVQDHVAASSDPVRRTIRVGTEA